MEGNGKSRLGTPEPVHIVITPPSPEPVTCAGDFQARLDSSACHVDNEAGDEINRQHFSVGSDAKNPTSGDKLENVISRGENHIENADIPEGEVTGGATHEARDVEVKNTDISVDTKHSGKENALAGAANAMHEASCAEKKPSEPEVDGSLDRCEGERVVNDSDEGRVVKAEAEETETTANRSEDTVNQPPGAEETPRTQLSSEGILQASNSSEISEKKSQADGLQGDARIIQGNGDSTSVNVSSVDTPLTNKDVASDPTVDREQEKPDKLQAQSPVDRKTEGSASATPKPTPESQLYFDHEEIASRFKEQSLKHRYLKGFIPHTNKEHTAATDYRRDLVLFCTVFAVFGTNFRKILPRIRRQPSLAALFETRISQYNVFTGTITKRIGKNVLTIERIANLAPQFVCQIVMDRNGKELNLSELGVPVPPAMQTTMFAGICPTGPPSYCLYFYYQLSRKFFNRPVSINEIKKRVATTYHSLLTPKERQDVCVKLNLATVNGEWKWNKTVLDVFEAAEKEWTKIKETNWSVRRVSLDFRDLWKSIELDILGKIVAYE